MGYFEHLDLYAPPIPLHEAARTDHIMRRLAGNPATAGSPAADAPEYGGAAVAWRPASDPAAATERREFLYYDPPPDAIRGLGDEMVMLAAGLGGGAALARALPYAARAGTQGLSSLAALGSKAADAVAFSRSFLHRLGRLPTVQELAQALGPAPDVGVNPAEGLGNPFRGRTPEQVNEMMRAKGFAERWRHPEVPMRRSYQNPRTDRSYHVSPEPTTWREGVELPHVDVHRPRSFRRGSYQGPLDDKRKWPLQENLYERE